MTLKNGSRKSKRRVEEVYRTKYCDVRCPKYDIDAQRAKVYQKCKMPHRVQFVLYSSGFSKAIYHVKHQKEWLIDKCLVLENRY